MPLQLVRQDITRMRVDVIVNAANTRLLMGGGVCGAIFRAAGARRLQEACDRLSPIRTGEAVATPGFDLPAHYVIHAAGPVWQGGGAGEERLLRDCYHNALELADRLDCASIAFPLISSGIYGYPKAEALHVAIDEIRRFLDETPGDDANEDANGGHDLDVTLCLFDRTAFATVSELDDQVREYVDDHYVAAHEERPSARLAEMRDLGIGASGISRTAMAPAGAPTAPRHGTNNAPVATPAPCDVAGALRDLDEPFNVILMQLIDAKGYDDVQVYKRANISRKLFSKIRCGNGYMPGKKTVLALALALRLDLDETEDLLACAGYALSHSVKFDVIVEFFITQGIFDVLTINETLFRYDQPLLGQ